MTAMTEDQKKIKKYVNAVERKLKMPLKMKVRINEDLGTDIHARMEAGQSVDEVLEALGSPEDVADRFNGELGAQVQSEAGLIRFLFLFLAVFMSVYTAYGFITDIYVRQFMDAYLRSPVTIIGGADGPTSVFVAYNIPVLGNWMLSGGFTLGCIDIYLYIKRKSRRKASLVLPGIASALGVIGGGVWIFGYWDIFQYWEMTWEFNFPAFLMLIELALPIVIFILRIKEISNKDVE